MVNKNTYKEAFTQATAIINEVDPMRLIEGGAPSDEYSKEVARTLVELKNSTSQEDFANRLKKVFDDQPGRDVHSILAARLIYLKKSVTGSDV